MNHQPFDTLASLYIYLRNDNYSATIKCQKIGRWNYCC